MFNKIRKRIESKRDSRDIFWKFLVTLKDGIWQLGQIKYLPKKAYYRVFYQIRSWFFAGKLPDFLVIGVKKGGTTSLWEHLRKHPDIEMSPNFISKFKAGGLNKKEVEFFDNIGNWIKGINWYKSLFNNNGKLQGEATPDYISTKTAHKKIQCFLSVVMHGILFQMEEDPPIHNTAPKAVFVHSAMYQ